MRTKTQFTEVFVSLSKTMACSLCKGSHHARARFMQTINPWNLRSDGVPKTREDIYQELQAEASAWRRDAIECPRRSGGALSGS